MAEDDGLSRNQERFLQALLLGQKVGEAARSASISERTATRWLQDPLIQQERKRREEELAKVEQAEIERILTTGYAATHHRVKALDQMARNLEQPYTSKNGHVYQLADNPEKVREWRACLDDIAKELGQRVKKADLTSAGEKMTAPNVMIYMPQEDKEEDDGHDSQDSSLSQAS